MNVDRSLAPDLILTPTRRLAHQLRVNHDAACDARGLAVWRTLEVLPWQTWIEAQYRLERQSGASLGRLLSPQAAGLIWRRLVEARSGRCGRPVAARSRARAAYRSLARCRPTRSPASCARRGRHTRDTQLRTLGAWLYALARRAWRCRSGSGFRVVSPRRIGAGTAATGRGSTS